MTYSGIFSVFLRFPSLLNSILTVVSSRLKEATSKHRSKHSIKHSFMPNVLFSALFKYHDPRWGSKGNQKTSVDRYFSKVLKCKSFKAEPGWKGVNRLTNTQVLPNFEPWPILQSQGTADVHTVFLIMPVSATRDIVQCCCRYKELDV